MASPKEASLVGRLLPSSYAYLVFLDGRCDNALPAAVLDFWLVRPSLSTADAALAAAADVSLEFFIHLSSSSLL